MARLVQGLLLDPHPHLELLLQGLLQGLVVLNEGVVLEGVLGELGVADGALTAEIRAPGLVEAPASAAP